MSDSKGIGASNEAFISFAFAVVSVILIVLYIPWIIRITRETLQYYSAPQKSRVASDNPVAKLWHSISYVPIVFVTLAKDPALLSEGAKLALKEKVFFLRSLAPKFLRFVLRPRILLPILWVILLSSAMYATLTFDPHAILDIPRSATTAEVKKAYRSLARRYHPDRNSTEEARVLFIQARRAYKALVDREAFEEEEAKSSSDFSVGVALPHFLISREHDGLVLFGLLGLLFGVPVFLWYKMTNNNKIEKLLNCVATDKEFAEHFAKHFGIPEDLKFMERRISRQIILRELVQLGICPKNVSEHVVEKFPPLPDFIQRCVDAEHQKTFLQKLGFNDNGIMLLQAHMVANGLSLLEGFEQQLAQIKGDEDLDQCLVSPAAYAVTKYFYKEHIDEVDMALKQLLEINDGIPSARKLLRLHDETLDNLEIIYTKGQKKSKIAWSQLVQMPQRVSELADGVQQELMLAFRRYYKMEMEKNSSKEQLRAYKKMNQGR